MKPSELVELCRRLAAVPAGSSEGLDRDTALDLRSPEADERDQAMVGLLRLVVRPRVWRAATISECPP